MMPSTISQGAGTVLDEQYDRTPARHPGEARPAAHTAVCDLLAKLGAEAQR
jgi:hypothetical protein